jgi:predicted secreted hydrolase
MKKLLPLFFLAVILLLMNTPLDSWGQKESPLSRNPMSLLAPHRNYKIEWWYVTGFLKAATGERMGFQGTFFRFATSYVHPAGLPDSPWEPREVVSFHGAISFLDKKIFVSREISRRSFRFLAGAHGNPFSVNVEENRLEGKKWTNSKDPVFFLKERVKGRLLTLTLSPKTGLLWQDPTGKLKTGPGANDWAWYYSYPDMSVSGKLARTDKSGSIAKTSVTGQAWFDHEWTDSALGRNQIGWIWMWGLFRVPHGESGFMAFQMIKKDGSFDDYRGGTIFSIVDRNIQFHYARSEEMSIPSFLGQKTQEGCLPKKIILTMKNLDSASGRPYFNGQELEGPTRYWEGAVGLSLKDKGSTASGRGYLEVTGIVNTSEFCKERMKNH